MAKKPKKRNRGKRRYKKREQARELRAENYFKQQAETINRLKPVISAWKRLNERAAQAERDAQNAVHTEKGGE